MSPPSANAPGRETQPGHAGGLTNPSQLDATFTNLNSPVASVVLETGSTLGPYRILQKLGEGGMGAVYKAQHTKLDKTVAVKVLSSAVTHQPDAVARFEREMRAVGKLTHPNIVQAFDAGEVQGTHYLAMEFIDGVDLQKFVKDRGPMSVVNACKVLRQATQALAAAHQAGLVHRDIKPSNLLVTKTGQVKLLDLGLARLAGEGSTHTVDLTSAGQAFGTPDYMAPEQWEDAHTADARTDLYALGCTLFFLLTGRAPYSNDTHRTAAHKMKGHIIDPVPDLQAARAEVPDELNALYHQLLAKKPAERLTSATQLVEALAPFSSSKPTANPSTVPTLPELPSIIVTDTPARRLAAGQPPRKPRRQGLIAGGAAALVLLFGVIVITITSKDGKQTTIKVPEGIEADVQAAPGSKVTIKQSATTPQPVGWHGWPVDAPKPALAPFDATQAKKHQEEWAAYLKVPVEYTNSIGMKFVLIPPGEFLMGSTEDEIRLALPIAGEDVLWQECIKSEGPQHVVLITRPFYLGVHEVTQSQYHKITGTNPSKFAPTGAWAEYVTGVDTAHLPVEGLSWDQAQDFCRRLMEREQLTSVKRDNLTPASLDFDTAYRLPSEAEWEFACRAGTLTQFYTGNTPDDLTRTGWWTSSSNDRTHAIGERQNNGFGLFDMHGNVWEWVLDAWHPQWYSTLVGGPAVNPLNPPGQISEHMTRGGNYSSGVWACRSASRCSEASSYSATRIGLRIALTVDGVRQALQASESPLTLNPVDAPKPAMAPFDAAQARAHQEAWARHLGVPVEFTNSIDIKFVLIPPGEFWMGSTPEVTAPLKLLKEGNERWLDSESPQHRVVISRPFYMALTETTVGQFRQFVNAMSYRTLAERTGGGEEWSKGEMTNVQNPANVWKSPALAVADDFPAVFLAPEDARAFCDWLARQEQLAPAYNGEQVASIQAPSYRLPTEAEWEYACRAGTTGLAFCDWENDAELRRFAWFKNDGDPSRHPVARKLPNPFGLFDMLGNVSEICQDRFQYESYATSEVVDPIGPASSNFGVLTRGGGIQSLKERCRSATRSYVATSVARAAGFRALLSVEAVRSLTLTTTADQQRPPPAKAPFDAAKARSHQEAWAKHLGTSVETTNSVGAKLILIPPGEFLMGAPAADTDASPQEKPQHRVTLTKPFAMSATEVTNRQFRQFVEATNYVTQAESDGQGAFDVSPKARRPTNLWNSPELKNKGGDDHPVRCVSWEDARRFCEWLTHTEGHSYRLPSEAEWEFACRAGTTTRYSFGDNFSDTSSPPGASGAPLRAVAQLPANPFGLFDMHGSLNEMCLDSGRAYTTDAVTDPLGSLAIDLPAVVRGGAISSNAARLRSSHRYLNDARRFPETNFATTVLGFRVVRDISPPPPIAKAPFDDQQAHAHQEAWAAHLKLPVEYTNSTGMKFRLIPPGEFLMGSTDEQVAAAHRLATEAKALPTALERIQLAERPQHRVVISRPFQFGATEVTNADFRKFVEATQYVTDAEKFGFGDDGEIQLTDKVKEEQKKLTWQTPGYSITDDLPVTQVSWNDAVAYCRWLSTQEQAVYRLPTEAEWEYACRAGTKMHYSFGDDELQLEQFGWYGRNAQGRPKAVGTKPANGFGLHDMHGNLFEWCQDIFDERWYQRSPSVDPIGPDSVPASGTYYVVRGGFWGGSAPLCRSAFRINHTAAYRHRSGGFRVVRDFRPAKE